MPPKSKSTKVKKNPSEIADEREMSAQHCADMGDQEQAAEEMECANTVRLLLRTLARLDQRVHSNYDFNADPDNITKEVGEALSGYTLTAPKKGSSHA